jgi:hypothetical protein
VKATSLLLDDMASTNAKAISGRFVTVEALWEEAQRLLREDLGTEKITDSTTLQETIRTLRDVQTQSSKQYSSGDRVNFKLSRILKRLNLLLNFGDAAMKSAPETVSVVWSAFRMLIRVCHPRLRSSRMIARLIVSQGITDDAAICEFVTNAVDKISDIMFTCDIYSRRYLKQGTTLPDEIRDKVLEQIPPLYAVVLKFSYQTRKLVGHSKFGMTPIVLPLSCSSTTVLMYTINLRTDSIPLAGRKSATARYNKRRQRQAGRTAALH